MFFVPSPPYVVPTTMIDVIKHLGLTSGLKLCLDAGDANSYSGSGQVWSDLSGGGYHFNRGADSSAGSDDPTFNGVAGRQSASEYWSFDGGDEFRLAQSNPSWIENLHKNNAIWSFALWIYYVGGGANTVSPLFLTGDSGADVGFSLAIDHDNDLSFVNVLNAVNTTEPFSFSATYSQAVPKNAWTFLAHSYTESTGIVSSRINDAHADEIGAVGSYTSPSSSSATFVARIGKTSTSAGPAGQQVFPSGTRLNTLAAWEGVALTPAQITAIYDATKAKFGH
jgi:hypothetical protein